MVLETADVWDKIANCESACAQAMAINNLPIPEMPARDLAVFIPGALPGKKGISFAEGQARLLHDLANIELQAMELGLRTLREFPWAPFGFREELVAVTISESQHLRLCLQGIEKLGYRWGHWPVHLALWKAVDSSDSLLDRILIVHRYLEGSGLDAGDTFLRRLDGLADNPIQKIVKTIVEDEIGHVEFGSRWYRQICKMEKIDASEDFPKRLEKFRYRIPKRIEKISRKYRQMAGFSESEIQYLENLRNSIVKFKAKDQASANNPDSVLSLSKPQS